MVNKYTLNQAITKSSNRFRSIASQFVACLSPNILLLDLGMAISFSTITVPVLLNASEGLSINEVQASWFGSIVFLAQPIGAIFSGPLVDYFGRKKGNFISNLPHLIAWTLSYYAWDLTTLFISSALLGLGTGLMESPINAYVSEVTHPSIRGVMSTLTQFWACIGIFFIYFLGALVTWRVAALIALIFPILSMIMVLAAPETPIWLLSIGREEEALNSLCYLRGWTTPDNVKDEFDMLLEYTKQLKQCVICSKDNKNLNDKAECEHDNMNAFKRTILKFKYTMICKETLRPFMLTVLYFIFLTMSGLFPIRPNMVNVCGAFGMAQDGNYIAVMVGVILMMASITVAVLIKIVGKRKIAITSMFGTFVFSLSLCLYAKYNLNDNVFSYDSKTFPKEKSYVPLVLFYLLTLFTGFAIPWVFLSEIFPFKSRGTAQGIAAACNYIITFIASKTFIDLEMSLSLWGTFSVYATFAFVGFVYLYFYLPETEGKTLQEIESYFNGDQTIFANDRFINCIKRKK